MENEKQHAPNGGRRREFLIPTFFGIRARLMVLAVVAVAPLLALIVFNVRRQNEREREMRLAEAFDHARNIAQRIDDELGNLDGLLVGLAHTVSANLADIARNEELFSAVRADLPPEVLDVKAFTPDGGSLGSSTRRRDPEPEYRRFVGNAIARGGLIIGEPNRSATAGKWTLILARPLRDGKKKPEGVIGVTLSLARLGELLAPANRIGPRERPEDSLFSVIDEKRMIVARSVEPEKWIGQESMDNPVVGQAPAAREGSLEFTAPDGSKRLVGYSTCTRAPWRVYAWMPSDAAFATSQAKFRDAMLLGGISLALALGLAWLISARITQPLRQLSIEAAALSTGGERRPSLVKTRSEVGVLVSAFNQMLLALNQREAALRRSEEQFRALIEQAADGIFITNTQGRYVEVNLSGAHMIGWSREELVDKGFSDTIVPEEHARIAPEIARVLAGDVVVSEWRFRRKDGKTFVGEVSTKLLADGRLLRTVRDITERQRAAAEQAQFERRLQATQKLESLGILAGGIAHDFNNILTSILGNASLASLDLPEGGAVQENLENIKQSSLRAADLCKQMLAYSGRGHFVVQKLNLNRLIEETSHLLQVSISKQAMLRYNLCAVLPMIEADATQIRQVIMNLVINASEAIGDKSGVIGLNTGMTHIDQAYLSGTLLAPELPAGNYVYLEVSDTGSGMSPEIQARIFEPFFTTKFAGRGLGLAAVLGIIRGHKGTLKIYSELGRGTTFKLLFPYAAGEEDAFAAIPAKTFWRGQGRVLVVDDEESVRTTAARMLQKLGFEVTLVADGREAVATFRDDPDRYVLVLLDLTMPHLDGGQTFIELRRLRPDIRVVLMSGFNEQEAVARFAGKGLASFLQKPFLFETLSETLQAVLTNDKKPGSLSDLAAGIPS